MKKFIFLSLFILNSGACLSADFSVEQIGADITLYYENDKMASKTISYIKSSYANLKQYFNITLKKTVTIYIISSTEKYNRYFNIPNHDFTSGFTKLDTNEIFIKAPTMLRYNIFDFEKIIVHELTHIFIADYTYPNQLPRWLHEGIAMELEPVWYWFNFRSIVLPYAFLSNRLISFKNLNKFPPEKFLLQISYEQSRDFVDFLIANFGKKNLLLLLRNYKETGNINSAMILTYNQPLGDMEYIWKNNLKSKYTWFYILRQTNFFWFLISLSALGGYVVLKIRRRKAKDLLEDTETDEPLSEDNTENEEAN